MEKFKSHGPTYLGTKAYGLFMVPSLCCNCANIVGCADLAQEKRSCDDCNDLARCVLRERVLQLETDERHKIDKSYTYCLVCKKNIQT